jgi:enoyl-CoA hydratase
MPDHILVETRGAVAVITLNRPQALNALNGALLDELAAAAASLDADPEIGCLVLTGSEKAFAAGADVKEMQDRRFPDTYVADYFAAFDRFAATRKPVVAAVAGHCLGGGAELAMACDIILAADTARFGQPEITLGIMPGLGGTQRLARAVGKAKAMEMILTGRRIDAAEAERAGIVARVVPAADLLAEAMKVAGTIAGFSRPIVMMAKESVARAFETPLAEGVRFERRLFQAMFATADQHEGMTAFVDKRPPHFTHR